MSIKIAKELKDTDSRIEIIQILRFIASLGIILFHSQVIGEWGQYGG